MIPLNQISVAAPCSASWDEMTGTEQARFCGGCSKNVYNLSAMSRADAERLIVEKEGHLCVRFYRRHDGTILTQDCPVGLRELRFRLAKRLSYAAALFLWGVQSAWAVVNPLHHHSKQKHVRAARPMKPHSQPSVTAGEVVVPPFIPLPPPVPPPPPPVPPMPSPTMGKIAVPASPPAQSPH